MGGALAPLVTSANCAHLRVWVVGWWLHVGKRRTVPAQTLSAAHGLRYAAYIILTRRRCEMRGLRRRHSSGCYSNACARQELRTKKCDPYRILRGISVKTAIESHRCSVRLSSATK